jgi:hypothetical protein
VNGLTNYVTDQNGGLRTSPAANCDMIELVFLFALIGSAGGGILGWFIRRAQGAILGAIAGALVGPILWIAGVFVFWPGV